MMTAESLSLARAMTAPQEAQEYFCRLEVDRAHPGHVGRSAAFRLPGRISLPAARSESWSSSRGEGMSMPAPEITSSILSTIAPTAFAASDPGKSSHTVRPAASADANNLSLGTVAITRVPVAAANLPTVSSSPSTPREFSTMPIRRGLSGVNLLIPFMMLFAAYSAMNSPEVTMITPSAFSSLRGTANPPHTTSPRTS